MSSSSSTPGIHRLTATEYVSLVDPAYVTATEFGNFYNHPDFPTRTDANQLYDCRCPQGEIDALLKLLEDSYAAAGLDFQKISGHDAATYDYLVAELLPRGWAVKREWLMPLEAEPQRAVNAEIQVRVVDDNNIRDLDALHMEDGKLQRGYLFSSAQDQRIGGERLLAYLNGEAIGCTGWFVVDGVARFRSVYTVDHARKQGAATTLIRHIQEHPTVRAQDGLVIFCGEDGPVPLYEQLGFAKRHQMWQFLLLLSK